MIDRCPRCDYSLEGLEIQQLCPECSLEIGDESECWREGARKEIVFDTFWRVALVFVMYHWALQELADSLVGSVIVLAVALTFTVLLGRRLWKALDFWREGEVVAVLPKGLYVSTMSHSPGLVDWRRIAKAQAAKGHRRPQVLVGYRDAMRYVTRMWISTGLNDEADAERFATMVNERVGRALCGDGNGAHEAGGTIIERCPRCDYLQKGLPAEHTCRECGLGFDAASECWIKRSRAVVIGYLLAAALVVAISGYVVFGFMGWGHWVRVLMGGGGLIVLSLLLGGAKRASRLMRQGACMAVTRDGLYIDKIDLPAELYEWTRLDRTELRTEMMKPVVYLFCRKPSITLEFRGFFRNWTEASRFVKVVNARIGDA